MLQSEWPWPAPREFLGVDPEIAKAIARANEFTKEIARMATTTPVLRCKMRVESVMHNKEADGSTRQEIVKLRAVYGPEGSANGDWAKFTPAANFEIYIDNPKAHGQLSKGHEFYVDFTPAE